MASAWNRFFAARRKRGLTAKQIGVEWRRKKRGTRKGQRRKTARRAFTGRRSPNPPRRKMPRKMVIPHPSITGMAAGFSLLDDLNKNDVIAKVLKGSYKDALTTISTNSQDLVKTPEGRTALVSAIGIAAIGTWARKAMPGTKLGGKKLYFVP